MGENREVFIAGVGANDLLSLLSLAELAEFYETGRFPECLRMPQGRALSFTELLGLGLLAKLVVHLAEAVSHTRCGIPPTPLSSAELLALNLTAAPCAPPADLASSRRELVVAA